MTANRSQRGDGEQGTTMRWRTSRSGVKANKSLLGDGEQVTREVLWVMKFILRAEVILREEGSRTFPGEGTGLGSEVRTVETGDTAAEQQKTYITDYLINASI